MEDGWGALGSLECKTLPGRKGNLALGMVKVFQKDTMYTFLRLTADKSRESWQGRVDM